MANKTVTVRPSGGDYTSIATAITGEQEANPDLVAMDGILTIQREGVWSTPESTNFTVSGFTVDATRYVQIIDISTGSNILTLDYNGRAARIVNWYTRVKGLTINNTNAAGVGFSLEGRYDSLDSTKTIGGSNGVWVFANNNNPHYIRNHESVGYSRYGLSGNQDPLTCYCSNSVFVSGTHGLYADYGETYNIRNCYFGNSSTADLAVVSSGAINITTCRTEDGSRSTSTIAYNTTNFTNITAGSEDLRPPAGSGLIDIGTDLSADANDPFNWDRLGVIRTGTWDCSPYEYVSEGQNVTPLGVYSSGTVGAPTAGQTFNVSPSGVISTTEVGAPEIGQTFSVIPLGVISTAEVGRPSASQEQSCVPLGVICQSVVGAPFAGQGQGCSPLGVISSALVGSPTTGQVFSVTPRGVISTGRVGAPGINRTAIQGLMKINFSGKATSVTFSGKRFNIIFRGEA